MMNCRPFSTAPEKIAAHRVQANQTLSEKEQLLSTHERTIQKLREELTRTHRLYLDGHVTAQGFGEFTNPLKND